MSNFSFKDGLTVHPSELHFPFELNKDNYSCSIQLTNNTDRIAAYRFMASRGGLLVSPKEDKYVGIIRAQSTCSVTLKVVLKTEAVDSMEWVNMTTEAVDSMDWINIWAHVAKDGVKAEDITRENLYGLTVQTSDYFELPVVVAAANSSSSAVPEKNNLIPRSINDEVHKMTSEGEGSKSSVWRQSSNEMSSIMLFSNNVIKRATNDLSVSSKIGNGGYGTVYKGNIHDTEVAIKILDSTSGQGIDEFHQEMEVLGRMRHPNLVKLIGACLKLRALVYEFLPHGSVEDHLKNNSGFLTWQIRTRIVYDICLALTFLHSIKPEPVVHGDLKPANILLDAKFSSKLADFGLCRLLPGGTTTVAFLKTKNIKGTEGYIDPNFLETWTLTAGCDVYSFGKTMLRILTGAPATEVYRKVKGAIRNNSLMAMVDSTAGEWPEDVAEFLAYKGLKCCGHERKSSKLMEDISTGLKDILAKMDI